MSSPIAQPDALGHWGQYGGRFVPETLMAPLEELTAAYFASRDDQSFQAELADLLHTGAHKINNTVGQVLLARRMNKQRIVAETGAGQHGVATATVCALFG